MPLPSDETLIADAQEVLGLLKGAFGTPGGYRPAHAKGIVLTGTFKPTPEAASLTKAIYFNSPSTPVTVRFSDSTGILQIPDNDPNAQPKGFAVRFHLPEVDGRRKHTDIVGHSVPLFPVQTGKDFGGFVKALGGGTIQEFLGAHPAALKFVTAPKPFPVSWGTENYFALNAFKFVDAGGKETYIRYEVVPVAGLAHLSDEDSKTKSPDYLSEEIKARVASGPVGFKLLAQIAEEGDPTDDVTKQWPEGRNKIELGTIELTKVDEDSGKTQKAIIFDPIPRVDGIVESEDPILQFRAGLYLLSGRERRAA